MKLDELLKDLFDEHIFGETEGYAWVIEYQKRGLPHAHILVILKHASDKPRTAEVIDKIVSTEIPHPDDPLHEIIKTGMIHGPCGHFNPNLACMKKRTCQGKCCKGFPFPYAEESRIDPEGFPLYKRVPGGHTVCFGTKFKDENGNAATFDTRWVVPYNPYLSRKYAAHINVEVSTSLKSLKYLYKYVYKGFDKAEGRGQ